MEAHENAALSLTFDSVQEPVIRMMMGHDHTGEELHMLREITRHYQPPAGACTTYRALADLDHDLRQHIHVEKNILFSRALAAASNQR